MALLRFILVALVALGATASALPVLACAPSCEVLAVGVAYAPAVVVVEPHVRVVFRALDGDHTATSVGCFHVAFDGQGDAGVSFEPRGDQLWAQHDGRDWTHCGSAQRRDDGRFLVTYECLEHADHVDGRIIVDAQANPRSPGLSSGMLDAFGAPPAKP